jgi:hypothetical protein
MEGRETHVRSSTRKWRMSWVMMKEVYLFTPVSNLILLQCTLLKLKNETTYSPHTQVLY